MSKNIQTRQLNVGIKTDLLNRAKSEAYAEGKKLYQWVEQAIQEKLSRSLLNSNDQVTELRDLMEIKP